MTLCIEYHVNHACWHVSAFGVTWGALVCGVLSFRWHVMTHVTSWGWKSVMTLMGVACVYVFVKLHMKPPQVVQPLDRQDLIQRIVDSAPSEGPVDLANDTDDAPPSSSSSSMTSRDDLQGTHHDDDDNDDDYDLSGDRDQLLPLPTSTILSKKDDGIRSGSGSNSSNSSGNNSGNGNSSSGSSKIALLANIADSPGKGGSVVGSGISNKALGSGSGSGSGVVNKGVKFTLSATSREEGAGGAGTAATTVVVTKGVGGGHSLQGPVVRLCTACLTDLNQLRARAVSHCASSGACVLAIEGYHDFVGKQQQQQQQQQQQHYHYSY